MPTITTHISQDLNTFEMFNCSLFKTPKPKAWLILKILPNLFDNACVDICRNTVSTSLFAFLEHVADLDTEVWSSRENTFYLLTKF